MNTKIIKLDLNKRLYDKITAKQDDTKSRFLLFQLLDGAIPFNLANRSVRVYGIKPDGTTVFNDLTITHSDTGFCLLELTNQMLAVVGIVKLELMITEGDKKLTTIPFELEVIKKINSNAAVESSNEFRSLLNVLKEIDQWNREFADKSGKLEELYTPRLNELGSQLDKIEIINILNYINLLKETNGVADWTDVFNQAFSDLSDGGILVIPNGEYKLTRATLQNKKGITINCSGTILPLDDEIPLIGTITIDNITDSIFNGITFDGNKDSVINTNKFGTQSLLRFDNSSNCIFNNLTFKNTCENGFNSNGNLNNIIFNNINIYNMGEHGFYFGGSNVKNIKFNNLYAECIGVSDINQARYTGVIKFRNKTAEDLMHDNISIDGFEFKDAQDGATGYKQLIIGYDVKNIIIKNGAIEGTRTCIFSSNISLDAIKIDNVKFNGKYVFYGFNSTTGYESEAVSGMRKIEISNSELTCECKNYLEITRISNSKIKLTGNWDDTMSLSDSDNDILFENVDFDMSEFRFAINKLKSSLNHKKCSYENMSPTSPVYEINSSEVCEIVFENIEENEEHSIFIQTNSPLKITLINDTIKSIIKTLSSLEEFSVYNCKLKTPKLDTNASSKVWKLNGVYDLLGNRFDYGLKSATCLSYNTSVNLDLRYVIAKTLEKGNLLVNNDKGIPFTYSIDGNIVTLSLTEQDRGSDTVFKVIYTL